MRYTYIMSDASAFKLDHEQYTLPAVVPKLCCLYLGFNLRFDICEGANYVAYYLLFHACSCVPPSPILWFVAFSWDSLVCLFQFHMCIYSFHTLEAAFYPGAIYYLSRWYTRKELGFRIAMYVVLML
jgi:hypothetical protein